ncbi:MAG: hypothetical protein ACREJ5_02360 [Geminicoccaceae bacterium]
MSVSRLLRILVLDGTAVLDYQSWRDILSFPSQMRDNRMMDANERELLRLRSLMRDPCYWRERDPRFVAVVSDGFDSLFGKEVERAELGRAANAAGVTGATHRRDLIIGHLAPGEIVIPPQALSPAVMAALRQELGDQLPRGSSSAPVSSAATRSAACRHSHPRPRTTVERLRTKYSISSRASSKTLAKMPPERRRGGWLILRNSSREIPCSERWSAPFRTRRRWDSDRITTAQEAAGENALRSSLPIQ